MKKIILIIVIFILAAGFLVTPAFSRERGLTKEEERVLDRYETEYVESTRQLLTSHALDYSGINMTKTMDENGVIEYTMCIHNERIDGMTVLEQRKLKEELSQISFGKENISITLAFI